MFKKRGEKKKYSSFFRKQRLWMASATLMGTVIGAGVLGIPYVVAQSGMAIGIASIIIVGIALLVLHLCLGEIVLRTKGRHQLSGYIEKYVGKPGKYFMTFSMIFGIYGALTAYLIGEGEILGKLFGFLLPFSIDIRVFAVLFFIIAGFVVYLGLKATGRAEMIVTSLMVLVVAAIFVFSLKNIDIANFAGLNWKSAFLPYGVILFAFVGTAAIPELREELHKEEHKIKKAILIGSIIPIIIYLVFTIVVVGSIGLANFNALLPNERIATVALTIYSNKYLGITANIFAIFAMFTSFIGLGLALKDMFELDYKLNRKLAYALTVFPPLAIAFTNLTTFIAVIGFTGAVAGGIDGILIMLSFLKAKKYGSRIPEYSLKIGKITAAILILMFSAGIIYQLFSTLF